MNTKVCTFGGLTIGFDHRVLELCAGVGHIGLGAVQDSARHLVMVDFNPVAQHFATSPKIGRC